MDIDWLELWRELINANPHTPDSEPIKRYQAHAREKRHRPDTLLDFVIKSLNRDSTVLDIGAGDGRWAVPIASVAGAVTAVEPAGEMLKLLRENAEAARVDIQVVQSSWENADVKNHDIAVSAHAVYSSPDLAAFVHKMELYAGNTCYLALRLPPADGIIAQLSNTIYGHPHDSANAVIAYNALYSLGIYANVLVENDISRWANDTPEEAFSRAKRHLRLEANGTYDGLIRDTLRKRLVLSEGRYLWPDGMRSALLWWQPSRQIA